MPQNQTKPNQKKKKKKKKKKNGRKGTSDKLRMLLRR